MSAGLSTAHPVRPSYDAFEFSGFELSGRTIRLRYRLTGGPEPALAFEERLDLPSALPAPDAADPIVRRLLDGIHRAFGVSYFKAAIPLNLLAAPVSEADAGFWNALYTEGLGEFWYGNRLDPRGRVSFPSGGASEPGPQRPIGYADERVLVLAGGGKDSAVAREVVRHAGVRADALSLGTAPWLRRSVTAMGLEHLVIRRTIDPGLFELNRRGAWNGHVPISACIAFVATLVAYVGGYGAVVAANEASADQGNVEWNGLSINHQWSKTLRFEQAFQEWCDRNVGQSPRYFSLLRPLGSLRIAEAFARHPAYFDSFTSCNANFRQGVLAEQPRWCGRCAKCVFVQLALRPHLDDDTLLAIFGGDFLSDPANAPVLEALVGLAESKPFDCVGTVEESRAALARLVSTGRLRTPLRDSILERVAAAVGDPEFAWRRATGFRAEHRIPPAWEERLLAYL